MRSAGGLWPRITSFENLFHAFLRARRGKRDREAVVRFELSLEPNLLALQRELRAGAYRPGAYRAFWITRPKRRLISAAPFRDRVVHHALIGVVGPLLERSLVDHAYASRRGKGSHAAVARALLLARRFRYVLKLDVEKYFPSIDHEILYERICRHVREPEVRSLVGTILDASNPQEPVFRHFPGDNLLSPLARRRGLPIGNLTSQTFANFLLSEIDHEATERLGVRGYVRYMDDVLCFGDDKRRLSVVRTALEEGLLALRLRAHPRKCEIAATRAGVPFLGFLLLPDRMRLLGTGVRRIVRRLRAQRVAGDPAAAARSLAGILGHAGRADARRLLATLLP